MSEEVIHRRYMSKTSYHKILAELQTYGMLESDVERFGNFIQTLFNFNPESKYPKSKNRYHGYTEKHLEAVQRYRAKKKEEGVSTYVSSGVKNSYYKKKVLEPDIDT